MSELKIFKDMEANCANCPFDITEGDIKRCYDDCGDKPNECYECSYLEYYLKSEADKVIAEKDAEIAELKSDYKEACGRLQTANLIKDEQLAATRHHKYKRCLDKAEMCKARYDAEDAKVNDGLSWEFISPEMKYWERWRNRWDALAEKFKEVK